MPKWARYLIGFIALLAVGGWSVDWIQQGVRRALSLTTAEPGLIGMVASASMEHVEVGVGTTFEKAITGRDKEARAIVTAVSRDHRIVFSVPAAFVSMRGKAAGDKHPWMVEFSVWHQTFEPFMRDVVLDRENRQRRDIKPNEPQRPDDYLARKLAETMSWCFKLQAAIAGTPMTATVL